MGQPVPQRAEAGDDQGTDGKQAKRRPEVTLDEAQAVDEAAQQTNLMNDDRLDCEAGVDNHPEPDDARYHHKDWH